MFWLIAAEIALVAVMLVLAPSPQSAKPSSLKDFQIPTADPGRCIPVVRGSGVIRGANVTWFGDLKISPIRKATGLFGMSHTTIGYMYYLGIHFQLCHGPIDFFTQITAEDRSFFDGEYGNGSLTINAPKLFGGTDTGGISGQLDTYVGDFTSTANDYLVSKLPGNVPAYRGVAGAVARQMYIGNSTYLKPWAFRIQSIYKQWDGSDQWYAAKAGVGIGGGAPQIIDVDAISNASTTKAGGLTAGVTVSGFAPEQVVLLTLPPGQTYTAWNWQLAWVNLVDVIPDADSAASFSVSEAGILPSTLGITGGHTTAEEARSAFGLKTITGASSYTFYFLDSPIGDNSEGLSIQLQVLNTIQINPAHFLRELLTARSWGMGYNTSDIDDDSFTAAADTLFEEGFGLFIDWTDEERIEELSKQILTHINAYCFLSPITGKFVLKLVRADYDPDTIPHLTDDDVVSWDDYAQVAPADSTASVTVTYTDPATGGDRSITVNNIAIAAQFSDSRGVTNSYPFIPNEDLATRAAQRDLRSLAPGIRSGQITCKRTAAAINPGDPFMLSSARLGLDEVVMRLVERTGDGIGDSRIQIKFVQDVFNLPDTSGVTSGDTLWTSPHSDPEVVTVRTVQETSYRDLRQGLGDGDSATMLADDPDGGLLMAAGAPPVADAISAGLDVDSGAGYVEATTLDFAPGGTLTGALAGDPSATAIVVASGSYLDTVTVGTLAAIGGEIIRVDAAVGTAITLGRGCLDTIPAAHTAGASIVFYDGHAYSDWVRYTVADVVNVKLLTLTGLGELDIADAPADAVTFNSRAIRPLRPADFQIEGTGIGTVSDPPDPMAVTWAQRNRQTDALAPASWTEADQSPEAGQTTTLILYQSDGTTEITRITGLTGAAYSLAHSSFAGAQTAFVKAISERDGYESLAGWTLGVAFVDEIISEDGDNLLSEDGDTLFSE